jgi:hypothetical protein
MAKELCIAHPGWLGAHVRGGHRSEQADGQTWRSAGARPACQIQFELYLQLKCVVVFT